MSVPVAFSGVSKAYAPAAGGAPVAALSGFDLDVSAGEFVAILGPSGSGKTTLLRLLAGMEQPDAGRVTAGGRSVDHIGPDRVLVAQDAGLFPWLTVEANIAFGLQMAGREPRKRVAELVQAVGLVGAERRYPKELSGGMRQRVALARALAVEPQVLLLDEPFAALDALSRETLQDVLESMWLRNRPTVLLVTHAVDEALRLADRVVVVSPRPARVVTTVPVEAARPREVAELGRLRRALGVLVRSG